MEKSFKEKYINPLIGGINKFYNSDWFIVFYSAMIILSWAVECEYIAVITSIASLIYMFLTQEHLDRMALIAIVIPAMVDNNMRYRINTGQIFILVGLVLLVVASGIYHFVKIHKPTERKLIKSQFFIVYAVTVVLLFTSGIGYPGNTFVKILIPVGVHLALLGLYCLLYKCGGPNLKNTIVKAIVALSGVIVVQMIIFFLRQVDLTYALISKGMSLGWAVTNSVAVILAFSIPLCLYLAMGKKIQLPYMLLSTIFYCFIFLTNCRSMMLVGTFVYFVSIILSFIYLNRWQAGLNLLLIAVLGFFAVRTVADKIFSQFIFFGFGGNGRLDQWAYYWGEFKNNWLFGMGFYTDTQFQADGMVRAHNNVLQILASMGIVGAIGAVPYFFQRYTAFVIKPTVFKLFAFVAYIAMIGYGLVDCAIISSYKLIITYLLLLAVEYDTLEYTPMPLNSLQWTKGVFNKVFKRSKN